MRLLIPTLHRYAGQGATPRQTQRVMFLLPFMEEGVRKTIWGWSERIARDPQTAGFASNVSARQMRAFSRKSEVGYSRSR